MKKVIVLHKKEGETPLLAIEGFKENNSGYLDVPMTYAGRLDPMASGVLVVLAGEEIKNKEKYLNLDKEYEFSVLFGFKTDTYDILGKVVDVFNVEGEISRKDLSAKIMRDLEFFRGTLKQKYPIYSSKTVKGKPLFEYAREGEDVEIPERDIFIKEIKFKKIRQIDAQKLFLNIEKRIAKVKGDFRQKEIMEIWKERLQKEKEKFYIADFKIKCSSGTYVRSIGDSLGEKIGVPALAFSIKRTKVGKFL